MAQTERLELSKPWFEAKGHSCWRLQVVPPDGVEPPSPDLQSSALPLSYGGMWRRWKDLKTKCYEVSRVTFKSLVSGRNAFGLRTQGAIPVGTCTCGCWGGTRTRTLLGNNQVSLPVGPPSIVGDPGENRTRFLSADNGLLGH